VIHLRSRDSVVRWPSCRACITSLTASDFLTPIVIRPFKVSSVSGDIVSLGDNLSPGGEVVFGSTRRRGVFPCSWTFGPYFRSIRCRHRFSTATERNAVPHGGYIMARLAAVEAIYKNTFISTSNVLFDISLILGESSQIFCLDISFSYSFGNGVFYFRYRENKQSSSRTTSQVCLVNVS
jgi:hypothetical protein